MIGSTNLVPQCQRTFIWIHYLLHQLELYSATTQTIDYVSCLDQWLPLPQLNTPRSPDCPTLKFKQLKGRMFIYLHAAIAVSMLVVLSFQQASSQQFFLCD